MPTLKCEAGGWSGVTVGSASVASDVEMGVALIVARALVGSVAEVIVGVDESTNSKVAKGNGTTALEVDVSVNGNRSRFSASLWQPNSAIKHRARKSGLLLPSKIFSVS